MTSQTKVQIGSARYAEAGPEVDRLIADWMGEDFDTPPPYSYREPGSLSLTDCSLRLRNAMGAHIQPWKNEWMCTMSFRGAAYGSFAPNPELAIARTCLVLREKGIKRADLDIAT